MGVNIQYELEALSLSLGDLYQWDVKSISSIFKIALNHPANRFHIKWNTELVSMVLSNKQKTLLLYNLGYLCFTS